MPILRKLEQYLTESNVEYEVKVHGEAFTAQEIAAAQHVPGRQVAKVVILKSNDSYIMAVIQAQCKVNLEKLKSELGAKEVRLATEEEFKDLFPDCELGAMPPFGTLYDIKVIVDDCLAEMKNIYFNAGTHTQTVKMKYEDYSKLVKPQLMDICTM